MRETTIRLAMVLGGLLLGAAAQWTMQRGARAASEERVTQAEARAKAVEETHAALVADKQRAEQTAADLRAEIAKLESDKAAEETERQEHREAKRQANIAAKQLARANAAVDLPKVAGAAGAWAANANDPDVARRLNEQARLQVARHYGPLFEQLALSPAQREQLTKLLADKRQTPVDVAAAALQSGTDPREDPATYADMIAATREDLEKQIQDLLGDAAYQNYQNFDRSAGQQQVIGRLNQLLADIQQPLTSAQTTQLQASMQANGVGRVTAKVVNEAAGFLSPVQMQALRDLRAIQQANSRKRNAVTPVLPTAPRGS